MLFRDKLDEQLRSKVEAFRRYDAGQVRDVTQYLACIQRLESGDYADLTGRLSNLENFGAFPASELSSADSFKFSFGLSWENHEQARRWAGDILEKRTTFAADGSQIYVAKATTLPAAAIQIGWFENPHDLDTPYEKNTRFEILSPDDLFKEDDDPMNPDIRVEERRYLGEVARVGDFLDKKRGWQIRGERMPVAFFDNPLLVPFSQKGLQKSFLDATVRLVQHSRETGVPLVGYVDRSFSRDILTLLETFESGREPMLTALYDASVLNARTSDGSRYLSDWGDRTCFCYSKRRGLDAFDDAATGLSNVGFTYLQTTADTPPARLDIPAWVYEAGLLSELVDVVRAECVIGLGYPYALETADQTAVISGHDREVFFRALQEFATRGKLDFSIGRKDESKARRR